MRLALAARLRLLRSFCMRIMRSYHLGSFADVSGTGSPSCVSQMAAKWARRAFGPLYCHTYVTLTRTSVRCVSSTAAFSTSYTSVRASFT